MALKNSIRLKSGVEIQDSYVNILNYSVAKHGKAIRVVMRAYLNQESFLEGNASLEGTENPLIFECTGNDFEAFFSPSIMDEEGINIESQIYAYLKTLEFFSTGFVDG